MLTRGRLALAIVAAFVPVLWLASGATGGKTPPAGAALYPDLQTAVPHHFTVQNFHPAHNHWHITGVALFEIRLAGDNGTGGRFGAVFSNQSIKTTFCLIDWIQLEGNSPTGDRTYFECFPDAAQGISAGWGDQYHHSLEGQELAITGAKPGIYYLVSTANPEGTFIETTTTNNTAWTSFRLSRDSNGNAKIAEISHSPCSGWQCGESLQNR
jgi:hypothetical protein